MSLTETVWGCLHEFLNENDQIRGPAENMFFALLKDRPVDVLNSLFEIIKTRPASREAFSALIQLCSFIQKKAVYVSTENQVFDAAYLVFIYKQFSEFTLDQNMPKMMHDYLIPLMVTLFLVSKMPHTPDFNEIWTFLDMLFNIPQYHADSLALYQILLQSVDAPIIINSFIQNPVKLNQVIKIDLTCSDQKTKHQAFLFILRFEKQSGADYNCQIINNSNLLTEILNSFDDQHFYEAYSLVVYLFFATDNSSINSTMPNLAESLIFILYSRIIDESNHDELFRRFCTNSLLNAMLSHGQFLNFFLNNIEKLMQIVFVSVYDPNRYPELFNSMVCDFETMTNCLSYDILRHIGNFLKENFLISPNVYVSSFAVRFLIAPEFLERGLFFASQSDEFLRSNGLRFLKLITKRYRNEMSSDIFLNVGNNLLSIFNQYVDLNALKIFSFWCRCAPPEVLIQAYDHVVDLCRKFPTQVEAILCGAAICVLNVPNRQQEFANFLLDLIAQLIIQENQQKAQEEELKGGDVLPSLMKALPLITRAAGKERTLFFMENAISFMCNDFKCLFKTGMTQILNQLQEDGYNRFGPQISMALMNVLRHSKSVRNENVDENEGIDSISEEITIRTKAMRAITKYAICFPNFHEEHLDDFVNECFRMIQIHKTEAVYINVFSAFKRLIIYFDQDENLFNKIFGVPFYFIYKFDETGEVQSAVKLIKTLCYSPLLNYHSNSDKVNIVFTQFPRIFEHCCNLFIDLMDNNAVIDMFIQTDLESISSLFLSIFEILLKNHQNLAILLIKNNFLNCDFVIFDEAVVNMWCCLLIDVDESLISDIWPLLLSKLFELIQTSEKMETKSIAISGLSNLFFKKTMNQELVSRFLEIIQNGLLMDGQLPADFYNHIVYSLLVIVTKYMNFSTPHYGEYLSLVLQVFPKCTFFNNLPFDLFFNLLVSCINFINNNIISKNDIGMIDFSMFVEKCIKVTCDAILAKRVDDMVLRSVLKKLEENLPNEAMRPIMAAIQTVL